MVCGMVVSIRVSGFNVGLEVGELLDEMKVKDVLVWTTLVSGYDQWGDLESANEMLEKNHLWLCQKWHGE
ncbi:hypothetical protein Gogos_005833 [Gossypium gossypioides]|uniref:Pentatricopeptide repeat-containing protein n=1 Tax=Gossypium gossypioides TaxID=34282 RepID=A0A7J9C4F4_GOSGO|nr:hypothetical protein [Gossypium gossypioides]